MFREEENQVALFIDWDNLAISTAADFGGASPDVKALVRVAQKYGTVLLARAYAEWQVPSDRLAVYRAGVDPIYAPTFRFEPDIAGQPSRGKSLADPCMVADCIDTLHLMPMVTHFVLVSGDKDLIPIVRMVQLRGKKVIVLGPDYAAAILREMSDEYISYRSIVDSGEAVTAVPEQFAAGTAARRRRAMQGQAPVRPVHAAPAPPPAQEIVTPPIAPAPPVQVTPPSPVATAPVIERPRPIRERSEPVERTERPERAERGRPVRPTEAAPAVPAAREVSAPQAVVAAPPVEAPAVEQPAVSPAEDTATLMSTITQILTEREKQGRGRLRATNLKDLLMSRMRGFNERRFGFVRFRDLLNAAEVAGVLRISQIGQVQWVSLPKQASDEPETTAGSAVSTPAAPESASPARVGLSADDNEMVRFLVDLRGRSRWLTYTYVLTNLITHQAQRGDPRTAEADARSALDRLVAEDVIRVDREPREIEVAGSRHRVRMCHIVETHPLVVEIIGQQPAPDQGVATEAAVVDAPPVVVPAQPVTSGLAALPESLLAPTPGVIPVSTPVTTPVVQSEPVVEAALPVAPAVTVEAAAVPEVPVKAEPAQPAIEAATAAPVAESPVADAPAPSTEEPKLPSIAEVHRVLAEVVRDAVTPERPVLGAAGVKTRLSKRFGSFDERAYGYGKFKDFLLAAEREGVIRVEVSGPATRVGLPASG